MRSRERSEHLKTLFGQFLSSRFKLHTTPFATYQFTFPNRIYFPAPFTAILFYHNSLALMSQQQRRLMADRTRPSRQERQRRREARRGRVQRSQSRDRLTIISPTLESVAAGSMVSRRGNGLASSRLEIQEPVPDNSEQDLASAGDSIDSHDGEYEGNNSQSEESRESQEENELGQHEDDEDQFAGLGGQRRIRHGFYNSQPSILTITPGNTQSSSRRMGYPRRRTPAPELLSQNRFTSAVLSRSSTLLNSLATPAITPSHSDPETPELEGGEGGTRTSSRRNMAVGLERSILAKACSLMWD